MLCLMEILFISLLLGSSLSFRSGLEAALSLADIFFCLPCYVRSATLKRFSRAVAAHSAKPVHQQASGTLGEKQNPESQQPYITEAVVETVENYTGLDKATQAAISNLFPSITWHFWRQDMLLERDVSLAVECWCFCIWSEPYDLSEKLN